MPHKTPPSHHQTWENTSIILEREWTLKWKKEEEVDERKKSKEKEDWIRTKSRKRGEVALTRALRMKS